MALRRTALLIGLAAILGSMTLAQAAEADAADDPLARLTNAVLHGGASGTLTARAAEMFGLPFREYSEKYFVVRKPDGTLRVVELVADNSSSHIFFSHQTGAQFITVRSDADGEFVTGLQRPNDSDEAEPLSANQGRVFLEMEKT